MKNLNRPENIIKGIDPVAVGLVKQMYSALLDRGENVVLYEKIWLKEVENAYKDQKTYDAYFINGLEILLKQAYNILTSDSKSWDIKEDEILAITEKILFLKVREDIYKDFFNDFESVLFSAIQLDFTRRVTFTQIGNSKENIFSYKAVMLNTLIETMQHSVVSMNALNEIVADVPGLIAIITDKNGNIKYLNNLGEQFLEINDHTWLNKNISDLLPEFAKIKKQIKSLDIVKDLQVELVFQSNSTSRFKALLSVKSVSKGLTAQEYIYLFKIQQNEFNTSEIDLRQQLHDKIAPINTLMAGLDLLSKKLIDDESKLLISNLKSTTARLKNNTTEELNSIISISNNSTEISELTDIGQMTDQIIEDLNLMNINNVEFIKEIHSTNFYSKRRLVKSILQNLISNSVNYRKPNKMTLVKVRFFPQEENMFTLQIIDTGIGIRQNELEKIFEPQYRVSSFIEGKGIGLSVVKDYVEKLSGKIEVESTFGKGTMFSVILPTLAK